MGQVVSLDHKFNSKHFTHIKHKNAELRCKRTRFILPSQKENALSHACLFLCHCCWRVLNSFTQRSHFPCLLNRFVQNVSEEFPHFWMTQRSFPSHYYFLIQQSDIVNGHGIKLIWAKDEKELTWALLRQWYVI